MFVERFKFGVNYVYCMKRTLFSLFLFLTILVIIFSVQAYAKTFPCDLTPEQEKQIESSLFEKIKNWNVGAKLVKINV